MLPLYEGILLVKCSGMARVVDISDCFSVQFSMNIYNAQLSRMSHCAPVARKPICVEFTPEAAVGDILIA